MTRPTLTFVAPWMMSLAPVFLIIPAFVLAGMGPCAFAHPFVLVVAFLLFIGLEVASLPRFVKFARATGKVTAAIVGMGLALFLLLLCAMLEYYVVADYWRDSQFS